MNHSDETPKQRVLRFLRSALSLSLDAMEELNDGKPRQAYQTADMARVDLELALAALELHAAENPNQR